MRLPRRLLRKLPARFNVPQIASLGYFDPKHEDDPVGANTVYRVVSTVNVDFLNDPTLTKYTDWFAIGTVIQGSGDNGTTWGENLQLNWPKSNSDGYCKTYEVSTLVYNALDDASMRWKSVSMCVYLDKRVGPGNYRNFDLCWLMMRTAPEVVGPWSSEIKLISGTSYDPNNRVDGGACLFTDVGGLVVSEPGMCAHPSGGFYLIYTCAVDADPANDLIKLCRIHHNGSAWVKTDIGQPFNMAADTAFIRSVGAAFPANYPHWPNCRGITACDIVNLAGVYHVIFTPQDINGFYGGFATCQFTNINTATLNRDGSSNLVLGGTSLDVANFHNGAATYSSKSTGSGMVTGYIDGGLPQPFTLVPTAVQLT